MAFVILVTSAYALLVALVFILWRGQVVLHGVQIRVIAIENTLNMRSRGSQLGSAHTHPDAADLHSAFDVGLTFPEVVGKLPGEGWALCLGLSRGCDACASIAVELPAHLDRLANVHVVVLESGPSWEFVDDNIAMMGVGPEFLKDSPFAMLVDPMHTIQGAAKLHGISDVLEFVSEGQGMGFGPGLSSAGAMELPVVGVSGNLPASAVK